MFRKHVSTDTYGHHQVAAQFNLRRNYNR